MLMPSASTPASIKRLERLPLPARRIAARRRSTRHHHAIAGRRALGQRRIVDRFGQRGHRGGRRIGQRLSLRHVGPASGLPVDQIDSHRRIASVAQEGHRSTGENRMVRQMSRTDPLSCRPQGGQEVELYERGPFAE